MIPQIFRMHRKSKWLFCLWRGAVLTLLIRASGGTCGRRLAVDKNVVLRQLPSDGWTVGDNVYLGAGVVLDVARDARFILGDRVKIMHYSLIGVALRVVIGSDSQIAERCTVRDQNHDYESSSMLTAPLVSTAVSIGTGVWIGCGVAVLRGASLGDGAVVGANAVVTSALPDRSISVGAPARVLRLRPPLL